MREAKKLNPERIVKVGEKDLLVGSSPTIITTNDWACSQENGRTRSGGKMKNYLQIIGRTKRYEKKLLYIPSLDKLTYCYGSDKNCFILGELGKFVNDAKNSIVRQQIKVNDLLKHNPVIIDEMQLQEYKFLHRHEYKFRGGYVWAVTSSHTYDQNGDLKFEEAIFLKDAPKPKTH